MASLDRRIAHRYVGKIPVRFREGTGVTRDFSTSGIYFFTDRPLHVGELLNFTLTLSSIDVNNPLSIHCIGDILRVERKSERYGVAARVLSHTFE